MNLLTVVKQLRDRSLRLSPRENARRRALHRLGLSDRDAARLLGITNRAFAKWRENRGLPRNHDIGGDRVSHETQHARRERLRVAAQHLQGENHV